MAQAAIKDTPAVKECYPCLPHPYQDEKYGKGKRFMNPRKGGHRCTVCGKEH